MKTIIILSIIFFANVINAQCPQENINLVSQTEVDSFKINYPDCTELSGDLTFAANSDIDNFSAFDEIVSIKGNLTIKGCSNVIEIDNFNKLEQIGGWLEIGTNRNLEILSGFTKLVEIDRLRIQNNRLLSGFEVFPNLKIIHTVLNIFSEIRFELILNHEIDLQGLFLKGNINFNVFNKTNNLNRVGLTDNTEITSFEEVSSRIPNSVIEINISNSEIFSMKGISNFDKISTLIFNNIEKLELNENLKSSTPISITLNNCGGFSNLDGISLFPIQNLNLNSLIDLQEINSFDDLTNLVKFDIRECHNLRNLRGLESNYSLEQAIIYKNENLSDCAIIPICEALINISESVMVLENLGACFNTDSIEIQCKKTSINFNHLEKISIFPNPVRDILSIENRSNTTIINITILDVSGRIIKVIDPNVKMLPTYELSLGSYLLSIETKENKFLMPFYKT